MRPFSLPWLGRSMVLYAGPMGDISDDGAMVDGANVDVLLVRSADDERSVIRALAGGSYAARGAILVLRSMAPGRRRRFVDAVESLGLTVRPLRRRMVRPLGPPGLEAGGFPWVARSAVAAVFTAPAVLAQLVLRLVGRGQRVLLVDGRSRGSGAAPPDTGVREPSGPPRPGKLGSITLR